MSLVCSARTTWVIRGFSGLYRLVCSILMRRENVVYEVIVAVEELSEMLGVIVFIYALLSYVSVHVQAVQLRFGEVKRGLRVQTEPSCL